ncbi:ion transporter [Variibacter gotjawalensis]|nr:ion transporter [Variibacter gotjawalensis]NIK48263.1 voltage-gated sodium channel [Variibacter gotjawalensis]
MTWLKKFVEDPRTDRLIMALIVLNAVTFGLETSKRIVATWGPTLDFIDNVILAVFVLELAARMIVQRGKFFKDGWNIFDFVVVGVALMPSTQAFSVLRALRILRVLRLITAVPTLRRVVDGLIASLPGMGSIALLIGLIYYVSAVMAVNLYGHDFPELFGSLPKSLFTLFTIMTLEGWVEGVVKPIMDKYPYAWAFFIPFIIATTFTVLNLFIGVIVSTMQELHEKAARAELKAERELVQDETEPLLAEVRALRREIAELKKAVTKPE